jgi:lysozyme
MPFPVVTKKQIGAVTAAALVIAIPLTKKWEGRNLVAQHFKIDPPGVITVCDGITNYDLPDLKIGDTFTDEQCDALLEEHYLRYAETIDGCVKVEIPASTRASLYDAAYNLGGGRICQSYIVRKINGGDLEGGCDVLLQYVYANRTFLQGLLNRRRDERKLCLSQEAR